MLLFYELAVMLKAAAGERVPKGLFSSFRGILNVHADTAAFHSCVSAGSASIIHGPLQPGAGRSPYTLCIYPTPTRHRARRRGGTPALPALAKRRDRFTKV